MKKIREILRQCFCFLLPFVDNYKINKKLHKEINENKDDYFCYIDNKNFNIEVLKDLYQNCLIGKDKLEDKAKINVVGITISITLIFSAYNLLDRISAKYNSNIVVIFAFAFILLAVLYMVIAGLLAIKVIVNENLVNTIPDKLLNSDEDEMCDEYKKCICINRKRNLIRNNYVYTSYECIRNSLVCLMLVFVLLIVPISTNSQNIAENVFDNDYSYSSNTVAFLEEENISFSEVEKTVQNYIDNNSLDCKNGVYGMCDLNNKLFVKFQIENENIKILIIEKIT